ncbi:hypothetical protein EDD22DRAFT_177517 [Suillus occidentalis]|nr:hypothetical protein EDD22DRAFT_177517 [Suillus occidentalis]
MRNRPIPNDGRRKPKKKTKVIAIGQRESEGPVQDAGFRSEPIVPPILLPTAQSSSSTIIATPSPQLDPPAAIHDFFVDQLPLPNSRSALSSICPEEDTSRTQDRETDVQFPPFRSDLEGAQTISSGLHDIPVYSSFSPLTSPPLLFPSTPISDTSRRIAQIPPSCPPSPAHPQGRTSIPYPAPPRNKTTQCERRRQIVIARCNQYRQKQRCISPRYKRQRYICHRKRSFSQAEE